MGFFQLSHVDAAPLAQDLIARARAARPAALESALKRGERHAAKQGPSNGSFWPESIRELFRRFRLQKRKGFPTFFWL